MKDIREGMVRVIMIAEAEVQMGKPRQRGDLDDAILAYLHSQGVVRKVDRELDETIGDKPYPMDLFHVILKEYLDNHNIVAVEPLIECENYNDLTQELSR